MCGLVGLWNLDGSKADEATVARMLQRIAHRGPDDHGTWVDGPVGLGASRLSILDLSPRGNQPLLTDDRTGVLAYNGEVYNFKDLRAELAHEGVAIRSTGDTEVVLQALHRWGPERAIRLFNGMFALAYFDRRTGTLWLARDRLGIKPLYTMRHANAFAFGSEVKALFAHEGLPCRPDVRALTIHAWTSFLDGPRPYPDWPPFEGIEPVEPGSIVKVTANETIVTTYFDVVRDLDLDRLRDASEGDPQALLNDFEGRLRESVSLHLVSDVPLATMCSGGVDSSLVTAYAHDSRADLVAYVADIAQFHEGRRAAVVARHLGVDLRQVDVSFPDYLRLWPESVWFNEQPTHYAQNVLFLAVARACRRDGVKVVLTGEGSDELFGGYGWYMDAYRRWRRRRLRAQIIPDTRLFRLLGRYVPKLRPVDLHMVELDPTSMLRIGHSGSELRKHAVIDGGRRIGRYETLFNKLNFVQPVEDRALLTHCLFELAGPLRSLLHHNDRMSMGASVECRVPYLENRVIDLGMHLPAIMKRRRGTAKWIVKAAAGRRLPRESVYASKIGFDVPDSVWMNAASILHRPALAELFRWRREDVPTLVEWLTADARSLRALLGMEVWARIFLRGETAERIGDALLGSLRKEARQAAGVLVE